MTPQEEFEKWRVRGWEDARDELGKLIETILEQCETPAVKAAANSEKQQQMLMRRGLLFAVVQSSYASELSRATAISGGYVTPAEYTAILAETRAFCDLTARGAGALCKKAPCDWKGLLADCGPLRECPKCHTKNLGPAVIDNNQGLILPPA